ncbi:MAG: hypothetical protein ACE5E6_13105, partial [Phycisphaerae bacterium]
MMNPYVGHSGLVAVLAGVCAFSAQAVERIDRCGDDAARGVWPGSAAMPVHRPATTDVPDRTPAVPAAVLSVASRVPDRLAPSAASAMTIAAIDGDDGDVPADIATIPSEDLRAGGDDKKRYFLIGRRDRAQVPDAGYALLVVLPGGDGGADFNPFVRRIYKYALNDRWLIAQVVAPRWNERQ